MRWGLASAFAALVLAANLGSAEDRPREFLEFIRQQAAAAQQACQGDELPADAAAWQQRSETLRKRFASAWGDWPATSAKTPPAVRKLGELDRDGYRLEKLTLETFPGVWMTAHAYVPKAEGKHPAILQVHGHWVGAKQDPHVQARCIGAVKHGFFVLAVDAFGAGERGLGEKLGEYHGEMVAATLYPVGTPLSGLQVYENMRAVDYLQSRPEVEGSKIGITGASGGGNQTMYAGAWDTRFGAAVPVCSVGNYQAYLGQACCMCEVVPGALQFTEEWSLLGLTAPRGLMVVNATRDAIQFSVGEAKKSLTRTEKVYSLTGQPGHLRHAVFESPHDYNQQMREAMYGWMKLHLAGEGDGSPLPDPAMTTDDPETIRCYPGDSRPDDWLSLTAYAAREGTKALQQVRRKSSPAELAERARLFTTAYVGRELAAPAIEPARTEGGMTQIDFSPEVGLHLTARVETPLEAKGDVGTVILLDLDGSVVAEKSELATEVRSAGLRLVTCDLRATGISAQPGDKIARAPDHNTAEWSLWIGRPLLGQWVQDVRQLLVALDRHDPALVRDVTVIGRGPAGLVGIAWAASEASIDKAPAGAGPNRRTVVAIGTMASYIHPAPYEGQRLGTMLPGVLRDVGDVADLVGLAKVPVLLANPTDGQGVALSSEQAERTFAAARAIRAALGSPAEIELKTGAAAPDILAALLAKKVPAN